MNDNVRAHVIVRGRVQRVFFRMATKNEADRIGGITGWVRNKPDRTVEAIFEGSKPDVETIIAWCHHGPPYASVQGVDVQMEAPSGEFTSFEIRY